MSAAVPASPTQTGRMETAPDEWWNTPRGLTHSLGISKEGLAVDATRTCSLDGCARPILARGLCGTHYQRQRLHGTTELQERRRTTGCAIDGCGNAHRAKGYCATHWRNDHVYGDPLGRKPLTPADERFWAKVEKTDACWLWRGAIADTGYGVFNAGAEIISSHRYAYLAEHGSIPEGLHLDHLCMVKACCNPAHLEAVTPAENARRARAAGLR